MTRVALSSAANGTLWGQRTDQTVKLLAGATAHVYAHTVPATTTPVTVYAAETGGTTMTQPLTVNSVGQLPGWCDSSSTDTVDIVYTYAGVTSPAAVTPLFGGPGVVLDTSVDATSPIAAASGGRGRGLRDVLSVRDFGATGTGTETTQIQAALDAAGAIGTAAAPAHLTFPAVPGSTYTVGNLAIPDNIIIEGRAVLTRAAGGSGNWITRSGGGASVNVTVRGLTFDLSNYTTSTDATQGCWWFANGSAHITLEDCTFLYHPYQCFVLINGTVANRHIRVRRNRFCTNAQLDWDTNVVQVWEPYDVDIRDNYFEGGGGITFSVNNLATPTAPTLPSASVTAGGSLSGTYYWKAAYLQNGAETAASNEVSATVSASSKASFAFTSIPAGVEQIKLYRATSSGAQSTNPSLVSAAIVPIGATSLTMVDTGVSNSYQNAGAAIAPGYTAVGTDSVGTGRDVTIENNRFQFVASTAILNRQSNGTAIENVRISGNRLTWCGYYFASSPLSPISTRKGLISFGNDTSGAGNTGMARNVTITGNQTRYCLGIAINCGFQQAGSVMQDVVISSNVLNGLAPGDVVDANSLSFGINVFQVTGCTISGNTIRGMAQSGIEHPSGPSSDLTIADNHIDTCVQAPDSILGAGPLTAKLGAIALFGQVNNVHIRGNTIRNPFSVNSVGTKLAGIVTNSTTYPNNVIVAHNRVYDDRVTKYMLYALNIGNSAGGSYPTDWTVTNNDFSDGAGGSGAFNAEPIIWSAASVNTNRYTIVSNRGSSVNTTVASDDTYGQGGYVCPLGISYGFNNLTLVAGTNYWVRGYTLTGRVINKVKLAVSTVEGSSGNDPCVVALYDSTGALLGSSASTTGVFNSASVRTINLAAGVTLASGSVFFVGLITPTSFTGSAPVLAGANLASGNYVELFAGGVPGIYAMSITGGTGSAPANMPNAAFSAPATAPILVAAT